jgi:predicted ATPase with chaperone activity
MSDQNPWPPEPQSVSETGLGFGFLTALALKAIYSASELTGQGVAECLRLPYARVVENLLAYLSKDDLVAITGSTGFGERAYKYVVTAKGMNKVQEILVRSQYSGPAPVPLSTYCAVTNSQAFGELVVNHRQLQEAFSHLVVSDAMLRRIGPAVNSGRSIFLYGPPGNGKTMLADAMSKLLAGAILIPYAVEVDGQIINIYDAVSHRIARESAAPAATSQPRDQRWVRCSRPHIVVGGELTLANLDLIFDPVSRIYEAPYQVKANGGIFSIDDFGRQQVSARDLLNRWIVPLDRRVDYLTLETGKKIEVPFHVLVVFSTNLDPSHLADDAFLRRIRHKIPVPNPTWDEFRMLFQRLCHKRGIPYAEDAFSYLVQRHYLDAGREPRVVHPRDLLDQIQDAARYLEIEPAMTSELLDQAVESYFVKL